MNLQRFAATALLLATTFGIGAAGCASNPDAADDTSGDDESALGSRVWEDLVGAYDVTSGPSFQQVVFTRTPEERGHHFFANADNGLRCVRAPCPSTDRIEGWYTAGAVTVTLHFTQSGNTTDQLEGRYRYTHSAKGRLTLTRSGVTHVLTPVGTFCDQDDDCGEQTYIRPMCVGHATCNLKTNRCGWRCGMEPLDAGVDASDAGPSDDGSVDASDGGKLDAGDSGKLDAGDSGKRDGGRGVGCGLTTCAVGDVCCNPLMGICTKPGMFCIQ